MNGVITFQQSCLGVGKPYSIHLECIEAVYETEGECVYLRTVSSDDVLLMSSYQETMDMWEDGVRNVLGMDKRENRH